jgi:hypothetical protein
LSYARKRRFALHFFDFLLHNSDETGGEGAAHNPRFYLGLDAWPSMRTSGFRTSASPRFAVLVGTSPSAIPPRAYPASTDSGFPIPNARLDAVAITRVDFGTIASFTKRRCWIVRYGDHDWELLCPADRMQVQPLRVDSDL